MTYAIRAPGLPEYFSGLGAGGGVIITGGPGGGVIIMGGPGGGVIITGGPGGGVIITGGPGGGVIITGGPGGGVIITGGPGGGRGEPWNVVTRCFKLADRDWIGLDWFGAPV